MPAKYEKIKQGLLEKNFSLAEAKTLAARIYNSQLKPGQKPVTREYDKKRK